MRVLLIEDEIAHCNEYVKCAENIPYEIDLEVSHGLAKAQELTVDGFYDVVLLDLELNESDGDGVCYLEWLKTTKLDYDRPYVVIITNNRSKTTHTIARNLGADYIFLKAKPDYSPRLVFDFAEKCHKSKPQEEPETRDIELITARVVEKIGFTHDIIGTNYIIHAVLTVIYGDKREPSMSKDIYPVLAKKFKKTDWSISRAIRTAIIRTWRITDTEILQENYTANIDYDTGIPTNRQMIFHIVSQVKREYATCD
ncbi:MAG: hypothetical protein FWH20_05425 [Oscillospiraceae bacterium]|nr:hypothetical protein [Oscillospiraceae bacterium]